MKKKLFYVVVLVAPLMATAPTILCAQSQEAVAVITELKLSQGEVQIRLPGKKVPEKPAVLQSLYPGTQIHASKDASAVILFTDGMRTVSISEKNSPFEVKAPQGKAGQGISRVKQVVRFLLGRKRPPTYVPLATRGAKQSPTLVSPRDTNLITNLPILEWMGMQRQTGTVRVYGPEGLLWEAKDIALTRIKYPSSAPRLKSGVQYWWAIEKKGLPVQKTQFKILTPDEVKPVQEQLRSLRSAAELSKTTLVILKAGLFIAHSLFHEAREILTEAVNVNPDEPTLHYLLGDIYEKTGLKNLALEEYNEAEFLLKK